VLADHRQGPFARLADRPGRLRLRLGEQALLLLERPASLLDLVRKAQSQIIDDILELLNKNGLTSHQSQNLFERLGRIIEMGQRVAKGTTY